MDEGDRAGRDWLVQTPIAHRGLHDNNLSVYENSLSAFRAAMNRGYTIECDVRLSKDEVPVVFHDDSLDRLTNRTGPVRALDAAELGTLRLGLTDDRISTFGEMLQTVAGRVPIVAELKGSSPEEDSRFIDRLVPLIENYDGKLALMSFDPWLVDQASRLSDRLPVGLTAEGTRADRLEQHRRTFAGKCSFLSYNTHHLPNSFVEWVRRNQRLPVISWTLRTPEEAERSRLYADQITFEGFLPPV